jgi:NADH:ubiquinone oxidoreductase subunit F (NADH-binding)/(2Fe-2S) ferredoxin/Pyruvate/2-oxoacid:ferredoxin oxidoreductase delta subunit
MNQIRFQSVQELKTYRLDLTNREKRKKRLVSVSAASCGRASGALEVAAALKEALEKNGLSDEVELRLTGCHGFCQFEPDVVIFPEKYFYPNLKPEKVWLIVEKTLIKNQIVEELALAGENGQRVLATVDELPFYRKQVRWLLDSHLTVDPESLDSYLLHDGFRALETILSGIEAEKIINEVVSSGLRGRGGAGFSTGLKWDLARQTRSDKKYLVCNGDEGDPGAYMDRGLLESNPFSIIEGMIIGGYAVGADKGFIYIRQEYPLAIERVERALEMSRAAGLLGENILGTGFSFDLELIRGAGAFVSGEETALIASVEGRRAFPRQRPPFPVAQGLWGKPTVINNVETWANVPLIIRRGPDWFSRVGTETSKGTKIFSLVGKVRYTGLVEIPFGITLNEVIGEVGGGPEPGKKIKAVQTGGPSGGCIPASLFHLPLDYETLQQAGSIMGSGGMIVIDEDTCLVDLILYFLRFASGESCGQCAPCRIGTRQMVRILEKIARGEGQLEDLDLLEKIGWTMREASLCGLGRTAANPVLSALRYFRSELESHVLDKECPAKVCQNLIAYKIEKAKCQLCQLCLQACPVEAIEEDREGYPEINQKLCTRCGVCYSACPAEFSALVKVNRKDLDPTFSTRDE